MARASLAFAARHEAPYHSDHGASGPIDPYGVMANNRFPLRVCPKSLSRITELSQHEPDGGKSEEGQCIAVEILKIFGKAPAAIEPGNCALDYPAFWEDHEPFGMIRTFDDFCFEAGKDLGKIGIEERALIRAVGEQFLQEWEHSKQRG